jgi:hypothetical protein
LDYVEFYRGTLFAFSGIGDNGFVSATNYCSGFYKIETKVGFAIELELNYQLVFPDVFSLLQATNNGKQRAGNFH